MCRVIEDMRKEEREEGREEGRRTNIKETALRMLRAGKYALEEIAEISGLFMDEVEALKNFD